MESQPSRLMPRKIYLGEFAQTTVGFLIKDNNPEWYAPPTDRMVFGFRIPPWQRGFVWTKEQDIAFIESLWKGVPVGTFSYVQNNCDVTDGYLIDGQQRIYALEKYIKGEFPVFGYYYDEVTVVDKRFFAFSTSFPCYIVSSSDETFLKEYYNLMNFGGTSHNKDERA